MKVCKKSRQGLAVPGLRPIRQALGLEIRAASEALGVHYNHYLKLETCQSCASGATVLAAIQYMGCTADDLIRVPTPARILEIRAAWLQAQADQARAEAQKAGVA